MTKKDIIVPDIGDFDEVEITEILVNVGDSVTIEDSLITVESDKASMEIPSSDSGTVLAIKVAIGDAISQGSVILTLDTENQTETANTTETEQPTTDAIPASAEGTPSINESIRKTILVPDIGDFDQVELTEILVSEGDRIDVEQSLITVESDKASMEIPSSDAGIVESLKVKVGDQIAKDSVILILKTTSQEKALTPEQTVESDTHTSVQTPQAPNNPAPIKPSPTAKIDEIIINSSYASPSVRKFARELGADLSKIKGSGRKNRIIKSDVKTFVKNILSQPPSTSSSTIGLGVAPLPDIDFSQWGNIETIKLSKINRLTGDIMHRNWATIPHVTQFDRADITEMDAFRKQMGQELKSDGVKITPLAFIVKAVVSSLQAYPRFNSSLAPDKQTLINKKYYHIGVAVDTPDGLVVPVIRDADTKSIIEISTEIRELAIKARDKKLSPNDMQGGCFTLSSLGGIGGTKFTPIINAPEVAILGVSRSEMQPVWDGNEFKPRLMLPLALSYDHRVIDGADGARFTTHLAKTLADIRRLLL